MVEKYAILTALRDCLVNGRLTFDSIDQMQGTLRLAGLKVHVFPSFGDEFAWIILDMINNEFYGAKTGYGRDVTEVSPVQSTITPVSLKEALRGITFSSVDEIVKYLSTTLSVLIIPAVLKWTFKDNCTDGKNAEENIFESSWSVTINSLPHTIVLELHGSSPYCPRSISVLDVIV